MAFSLRFLILIGFATACDISELPDDSSQIPNTGSSGGETGASDDNSSSGETGASDTDAVCESFADDKDGATPVTFEIRNETDAPILLPIPCGESDFLTLTSAEEWSYPQWFCSSTCEVGDDPVCGGCASSSYIFVPAQGSASSYWAGFMYETVSQPSTCPGGGNDCQIQRAPSVGSTLHLSVVATKLGDCEAAAAAMEEDPSTCSCTPKESGTCHTYGWPADATLTAETDFEVGASTTVVVTFD